jgi:hypothetical protein
MALDLLFVKIIRVPKRQAIASELAGEIFFRKGRTLVGQVGLVPDEIDAPAETFLAKGLDTLDGCLTRPDQYDSFRHGRQG